MKLLGRKTEEASGEGRVITNDMLAGAFFIGCAVVIFSLSRSLTLGTSFQPGAGYLPTGIAALLLLLGIAIALPDILRKTSGEAFVIPRARPFLAPVAILVFGVLIQPLGFIISAFALIALAFVAYGKVRLIELVSLSVVLISACILVFVVGLGQRIPLLP